MAGPDGPEIPGTGAQPQEPGGQTEQQGDEQPPPATPPVFPSRPQQQQPQQEATSRPQPGLVTPTPGTLNRSAEQLTREIGFQALATAIQSSAVALYPDDPKAVALTVANCLQPYLGAFMPGGPTGFERAVATQGMSPGASSQGMSKHTEGIILGAITGKRSQEVAKYQHTFPTFPGDTCRDDVDLWEKYWESVFGSRKWYNALMTSWHS